MNWIYKNASPKHPYLFVVFFRPPSQTIEWEEKNVYSKYGLGQPRNS